MDPITALLPTTPAEPPLGEYTFHDRSSEYIGRSVQMLALFPNGFGASVIQNQFSYGGDEGLYELAVLHGEDQRICYMTPVSDDVVGWLTEEAVVVTLHSIAALERNDLCVHSRGYNYFEEDDKE